MYVCVRKRERNPETSGGPRGSRESFHARGVGRVWPSTKFAAPENWPARALASEGINRVGTDAVGGPDGRRRTATQSEFRI